MNASFFVGALVLNLTIPLSGDAPVIIAADETKPNPTFSTENIPWEKDASRAYWAGDCDTVYERLDDGLKTEHAGIAYGILGALAEFGDCGPQDYEKAAKMYSKTMESGYKHTVLWLGYFYLNGLGVPRDPAEARTLFRYYLLEMLDQTSGERRKKARDLMRSRGGIPAELEAELQWRDTLDTDPRGQLEAGRRLADADGLPHKPYLGYIWMSKAAQQRYPEALYELGLRLIVSDGTEAFANQKHLGWSFLGMAGKSDFMPAQLELGRRFALRQVDGHIETTPKDFDYMAYAWLLRARRNGANVGTLIDEVESRLPEYRVRRARKWAQTPALESYP